MKKNWMMSLSGLSLAFLVSGTLAISGCGNSETASDGAAGSGSPAVTNVDNSHGGWWCVEHGVPEEECALCDKTLVSKYKDADDWCDEHARPESQCFLCSPARFDKFAARYEAKTGHKPPQPEE
ncbi:hypothetical protein Q31b_31540 [Novipirellula aureliae]|uniref:RND transporter n=1 Tax=Novipirellula aureliae TaxID=2527966 RepID=A0A5C6DYA1_9BACT|nr:RND transporter [Novipirellula aureliae]TWU39839.1 hypothetical protein Q31b_31540 [Novipirellula aureliae]